MSKKSPVDVRYTGQLSDSLRRLRAERGLSLRELARQARVSPDTVSQLERGSSEPTLDTLLRLQAVLKLPSLELLLAGQLAFISAELGAALVVDGPPEATGSTSRTV